jgi:molybdopterin synthase sulfur carrier subunit
MIRVVLPAHLRTLARVSGEVTLEVEGPATQRSVLDALEARYPMLRGTIRDQVTHQRRPFVRFFACEQDLSHESPDAPLPEATVSGAEPLLIVGAIAGGATEPVCGAAFQAAAARALPVQMDYFPNEVAPIPNAVSRCYFWRSYL